MTGITVLRFSVDNPRELQPDERLYRVELHDGREATLAATKIEIQDGALVAYSGTLPALVLAGSTWRSVRAADTEPIIDLPEPPPEPPPKPKPEPKPSKPEKPPAKGPPARPRGIPLPDDWQPTRELIDALHAEYPTVDLRVEFTKFVAYYRSLPAEKAYRADWAVVYRAWIRNHVESLGQS